MAMVICISDISSVFYREESGILGPGNFFHGQSEFGGLAEAIYTQRLCG